jgi:hypothetical protein
MRTKGFIPMNDSFGFLVLGSELTGNERSIISGGLSVVTTQRGALFSSVRRVHRSSW